MADHLLRDVVRRRWYVLLAGLGATGLALLLLTQAAGTHHLRSELVFYAPGGRPGFVEDVPPGASLIPFVAAVDTRANEGGDLTFPSTRAQLPGWGLKSGTWTRIIDEGGQWTQSFSAPTIVVEAVDPDPDRAEQLFDQAVARVENAARTLQTEHGVPSQSRVMVTFGEVEHALVGPGPSQIARAAVVVLGIGLFSSVVLARTVDAMLPGTPTGRHRDGKR